MLTHVTGVLQAIADALQSLHFSVEHVKSTQREHGHLIDRLIAQSAPAQEKKNRWKCKLPLTTVKQFVDFEKEVEDEQKKADMVSEVRQDFLFFHSILVIHRSKSLVYVGGTSFTNCLTRAMGHVLNDELAVHFCFDGCNPQKRKFNGSKPRECYRPKCGVTDGR